MYKPMSDHIGLRLIIVFMKI